MAKPKARSSANRARRKSPAAKPADGHKPTKSAKSADATGAQPASGKFSVCKQCPYPSSCEGRGVCVIQSTAAARGKEARDKASAEFTPCPDCDVPAGCSGLARCRRELLRGRPDPVTKKPKGRRPSAYSADLAKRICDGLARGEGLREICAADDMPSEALVRSWYVDDVEGFAAQYARARDIGLDVRADRLKETAAMALGLPNDGVNAVRLIVDTEKWYLSKLAPKRYGDKLEVDLRDERKLSDDQLDQLAASLLAKAAVVKPDAGGA